MSTASLRPIAPTAFASRWVDVARDIKISHTVFALPWALLSTCLAHKVWITRHVGPESRFAFLRQLLLIVTCMVLARTVAMLANRLVDARLDRLNPRTAGRSIPSGRLSPRFMLLTAVVCGVLFIAVTSLFWVWFSNRIPLLASVPVIAFVCAYPFLKRFTAFCHLYLGTALALAPMCAWVAVTGTLDTAPLLMAGAVLLWTAGFDIIYACQDYPSDLATGVFSIPAKFGIAHALRISRLLHVGCVAFLVALGQSVPQFTTLYFVGVGIVILLLIIEHALIRPNDLSRVNAAFFTLNGIISVTLGALGILDLYV